MLEGGGGAARWWWGGGRGGAAGGGGRDGRRGGRWGGGRARVGGARSGRLVGGGPRGGGLGAGGFQTHRPVLVDQAQDPLRGSQPEQGVDRQQIVDHRPTRRSDVGGLGPAPNRGAHMERDLLRRVVRQIGLL